MNNLDMSKLRLSPRQILWVSYAVAFILLGFLAWQYFVTLRTQAESFWTNRLVTIIILVPAVSAAITGTLLTRQFGKGESPHRIWLAFTIGLWFWVAGEIIGSNIDFFPGAAFTSDINLVDLFWLLGYFFLGLSLYFQILLVYGIQKKQGVPLYLGMVALALLVALVLTNLTIKAGRGEGSSWALLFVTILYPVLDAMAGATAIWLSILFGRGQWSRPWWGLILFAVTDGIDAFYRSGGYNFIPAWFQNTLDLTSLLAYPASYMVAGITLFANYCILQYGADSGLLSPAKRP